ncbi:hypothetical protein MTR_2g088480 [Medicago truncatula]|uniref:Uncharacterized protein n=1 Tax=Medicago truncatula TaxID=3880 RepID=G7IKI1_MEDTR|nr:hypothetical protein MTR_2g088480 [Medicago truncatula]
MLVLVKVEEYNYFLRHHLYKLEAASRRLDQAQHDGACKDTRVIAGCGDLFRDSDGRWIKGYTKKIGACDALYVEILIDMISDNFKFNENIPVLVYRI